MRERSDKPRKQLVELETFIPVYAASLIRKSQQLLDQNHTNPKNTRLQKAFPMRLKNDMQTFLSSCSLRMNCPYILKYAFVPETGS